MHALVDEAEERGAAATDIEPALRGAHAHLFGHAHQRRIDDPLPSGAERPTQDVAAKTRSSEEALVLEPALELRHTGIVARGVPVYDRWTNGLTVQHVGQGSRCAPD